MNKKSILEVVIDFMNIFGPSSTQKMVDMVMKKNAKERNFPAYVKRYHGEESGIFHLVLGPKSSPPEVLDVICLDASHKSFLSEKIFDLRIFEREHAYMMHLPNLPENSQILVASDVSLHFNGYEVFDLRKQDSIDSEGSQSISIYLEQDKELNEYTVKIFLEMRSAKGERKLKVLDVAKASGTISIHHLKAEADQYAYDVMKPEQTKQRVQEPELAEVN